MKTNKALKTQSVEPKFRKEAERMILTWGPYKLAPPKVRYGVENIRTLLCCVLNIGVSQMPPKVPFFDAGTTMWTDILEGIPKNATYLWANTSIVYDDGTDATIDNGVYLHHYGIFDMDKTTKRVSSCIGILTPTRPSLFRGGVEDKGDRLLARLPTASSTAGFYVGAKG